MFPMNEKCTRFNDERSIRVNENQLKELNLILKKKLIIFFLLN